MKLAKLLTAVVFIGGVALMGSSMSFAQSNEELPPPGQVKQDLQTSVAQAKVNQQQRDLQQADIAALNAAKASGDPNAIAAAQQKLQSDHQTLKQDQGQLRTDHKNRRKASWSNHKARRQS